MSGTGSGSSSNTNNTNRSDSEFKTDRTESRALRYWVPTASKLSRGKKGIIQRMFTGEPLNNLCNVYVYNETTKVWYHEHTIPGDPNRNGNVTVVPSLLTSSSQTINGITYTTSASQNNGDAYKSFKPFDIPLKPLVCWSSDTPSTYPHNQPSGYSGTWVPGTYTGSSSLGGVSGEWLKIQVSSGIQPTRFKMYNMEAVEGSHTTVKTFTILGSNDDSTWTNLGNFTNTNPLTTFDWYADLDDSLTINTTYTYFALVLKSRAQTNNWYAYNSEVIEIPAFTLYTSYPSEDFGRSLDGTDNADMVAVGGPGTWFGSVSNIDGYAKVFTKNSSGNGWTQRGSEVSQQGGFGHSVALSQYDGNILVVGAPFYNTLIPSASGDINFHSVPVSEGKVYIYKWNGTNYTLQQTLNSPSGTLSTTTPTTWKNFYFGYSLGITDIGDKIIVGEPSIRNIWYEPDQLQGAANGAIYPTIAHINSFQYTGNAHVYDNVTVLSSGTMNWTSNVSMTSVIGTTGIGTTDDTNPLKVRWLDALGTSVDINRAGTRILAGGPGSYGTSKTAPHAMSGRIYTLDWDPIDAEWKEMGEVAKHIVAPQGNMLLGKTTRFDGSGRRIVSGATGFVDNITYNKGNILIFDFNGDQWVSFPNEMVELAGSFVYWTNYQHKLGESISIDGEGEMVAIGKSENHYDLYNSTASPASQVSGGFTVDDITYIGGATTSVAGSDSQISTGGSTIWVYNISQSMVIKGNVTIGGYIQGTGISIGTNDDSSTSNKSIYFGGSKSDNAYELTVIENRVYEAEEKAELLLFKGNDNADASGGGTFGPDRIRLKGGQIVFDLNAGYDRTAEDIRAVMHRNAGGAGMLGINVTSPTEVIHVDGKIKATQGFIGRGTELTGLNFNYINNKSDLKFGQAGATQSSTTWGGITLGSSIAYPTLALNSNSQSGYTVTASTDSVNAYKAFDDNLSTYWNFNEYSNSGVGGERGRYIGSTEKVSGYKGAWIELQIPNRIHLTKLDITADSFSQPRKAHVFGSNDGIEYDLIHYTGDLGAFWSSTGNRQAERSSPTTIFTRTPNYIEDNVYDRILIIVNMTSSQAEWYNIDIYGIVGTYNPKIKLDYTGKIGIKNTSPLYDLDVTGDINLTGDLRIGGVAQSFGGFSGDIADYITHTGDTNTKFGFPANDTFSVTTNNAERFTINDIGQSHFLENVGIKKTSPAYALDVYGDINLTGILRVGASASTGTSGQVLTSGGSSNPSVWGDVPLPSLYNYGGIVSDNNSLRIDLAASDSLGDLSISKGGTGTTSFTYDHGLIYYDNGNSELKSIQASGVSNTVLLTGSAGSVPIWGLVTLGTHTQGNYVSSITAGGGITATSGTTPQIDVSRDASGGIGINGSGELLIDFTNTTNIIGQLPASLVSGGSSPWTTSGSNIYRSSGQVNIGGSTFTRAKLEINGSYSSYLLFRFYAYGPGTGLSSGTNTYSIYASQRIAANEFNAHSDRRIKKNVVDINDSSALEKIRLLEPKIYNYIDEKQRGTSNVYGFIAQEVATVLPYAVTVSEGDIPNILTNSNVSVTSDSNILELRLDTTVEGLTLSNTSVINIITDEDKELKCNVLSFSESNVITIENTGDFSNVTNAFIKGEQISDFHHLNKDAIWAVSTAALQEVDRQLQAEKTKVVTLETQVANLLARVTALENN